MPRYGKDRFTSLLVEYRCQVSREFDMLFLVLANGYFGRAGRIVNRCVWPVSNEKRTCIAECPQLEVQDTQIGRDVTWTRPLLLRCLHCVPSLSGTV